MSKNILNDLYSVKGDVVIVTGGAGRLGTHFIETLHRAGATVVSFDVVKSPQLDGIAEQMKVDITDRQAVFRAVDAVNKKFGTIHTLINNAAFNPKVGKDAGDTGEDCWSPHEKYPEMLWEKEFAIGLHGAMWCTQAVARDMLRTKKGSIINIASTSAITAPDHRKYEKGKFKSAAYSVVKTALLGFTRSWASYFASTAPGVRVNAVAFGAVNFGSMEPEFLAKLGSRNMLGRPASPDEYGGIVLFLASPASRFITASTLVADGGQTAW
jgi:NAD(P)-dependent dehydrogenase (short-subunit alcohol dehydrogenase family)